MRLVCICVSVLYWRVYVCVCVCVCARVRKLLTWLPHKRQLLWDDLWQRNGAVNGVLGCERVRTMLPGQVHVRLDFIKNAELRSPNQAQREYFISLGM